MWDTISDWPLYVSQQLFYSRSMPTRIFTGNTAYEYLSWACHTSTTKKFILSIVNQNLLKKLHPKFNLKCFWMVAYFCSLWWRKMFNNVASFHSHKTLFFNIIIYIEQHIRTAWIDLPGINTYNKYNILRWIRGCIFTILNFLHNLGTGPIS